MNKRHAIYGDTMLPQDIEKLRQNDVEMLETLYLFSNDKIQIILAANLLTMMGHSLPEEPKARA